MSSSLEICCAVAAKPESRINAEKIRVLFIGDGLCFGSSLEFKRTFEVRLVWQSICAKPIHSICNRLNGKNLVWTDAYHVPTGPSTSHNLHPRRSHQLRASNGWMHAVRCPIVAR